MDVTLANRCLLQYNNLKHFIIAFTTLDKTRFEEWKTRYYTFEGWDTETGYPTRSTLEGLGLIYIADALDAKGKLGKENKAA
jgi:aldehyde:ferredoxin oxidoreductase